MSLEGTWSLSVADAGGVEVHQSSEFIDDQTSTVASISRDIGRPHRLSAPVRPVDHALDYCNAVRVPDLRQQQPSVGAVQPHGLYHLLARTHGGDYDTADNGYDPSDPSVN